MRKLFVLIGLVIIVISCKKSEQKHETTKANIEREYDEIESLKWLVGNWTNIGPDQQSYENWIQKNDSTLTAYSYTTVLSDTVFQESMMVQQSSDSVYLVVSVPNQNEEKPVTFKLMPKVDKVFTFVNGKHDFPNKITYSNPVKDSIHAWIEGEVDSTYKKMDFYFKRSD